MDIQTPSLSQGGGITPGAPTLTGGRLLGGSGQLPPKMGSGQAGPVIGEQAPVELTPQEKAQSEKDAHRLVTRGMELIHSPQTRDAMVQALKDNSNLVQAVADQAKVIIQRVESDARKEGVKLGDISKLMGCKDLVGEIAAVAEVSGAGSLDPDDQDLAFSVAAQDYLKEEIAAGRLDPKNLQGQIKQMLLSLPKDQLEAANKTSLKINATADKWKDKDPMMAGPTAKVGQSTDTVAPTGGAV